MINICFCSLIPKYKSQPSYLLPIQLYIRCIKSDIDNYILKLNQEFDNIFKWAFVNGLCLNANKSKAIIIGKVGLLSNPLPPLAGGDSPVALVECAKNLDIIYNSQLSWTNHVNTICGKRYAMLGNLCMTQSFTPFNIRILLKKTYLNPTLLYGCELFAGMVSVSKNKFNVTYNNTARYTYFWT